MKPLIIALMFVCGSTPHSEQLAAPVFTEAPAQVQQIKLISKLTTELKPLDRLTAIKITYPGNDYAPGNCTWLVKSLRTDIPNNLGNANTWFYLASAQGLPVGHSPQVGAVAQTTGDSWLGHVAYVEAINPDGSFVIVAMNEVGYAVVTTRTATTAEFPNFIY